VCAWLRLGHLATTVSLPLRTGQIAVVECVSTVQRCSEFSCSDSRIGSNCNLINPISQYLCHSTVNSSSKEDQSAEEPRTAHFGLQFFTFPSLPSTLVKRWSLPVYIYLGHWLTFLTVKRAPNDGGRCLGRIVRRIGGRIVRRRAASRMGGRCGSDVHTHISEEPESHMLHGPGP
jgi:hypothetical protein